MKDTMKVQSLSKKQVTFCYDELARIRKFPYNTVLHQSILELIDLELEGAEQMDILDAGCGAGFFGLHFSDFGHHLTFLDSSIESLKNAQERSRAGGDRDSIIAVAGDVEHLPFQSNSFDAIVCVFVFSHLIDPDRALGELRRVLRRDGRLIVNFENRIWHAIAAGLRERYEEAIWLMSSAEPIVKAYDILPPVRLYSIQEIEELCFKHDLKIDSLTGLRHVISYQEPLQGIRTTETEYMLWDSEKAKELEELFAGRGDLRCLARHLLICVSL